MCSISLPHSPPGIESHLDEEAMEDEIQLETNATPFHRRVEYAVEVEILVRLMQDVSGVVGNVEEISGSATRRHSSRGRSAATVSRSDTSPATIRTRAPGPASSASTSAAPGASAPLRRTRGVHGHRRSPRNTAGVTARQAALSAVRNMVQVPGEASRTDLSSVRGIRAASMVCHTSPRCSPRECLTQRGRNPLTIRLAFVNRGTRPPARGPEPAGQATGCRPFDERYGT